MEHWEQDFEWVQLRHRLKERFNRDALPDLNAVLFLIGIQELGFVKNAFTKEEKQDLMHIAVCRLLSDEGYYEFIGRDADGWPHWRAIRPFSTKGLEDQEQFLIAKIIAYFKTEVEGL